MENAILVSEDTFGPGQVRQPLGCFPDNMSRFVHVHMYVLAPCVFGMLGVVAILLFAFMVRCKF